MVKIMEYGDVKERIIELTKLLAKYEELINNKTMTELELNEPINLVKAELDILLKRVLED